MTAPLYDIKAKFSEYVTRAENGDVIEITKHGITTAVIISLKEYTNLKEEHARRTAPSFMDRVRKWRAEHPDCIGDYLEQAIEEAKKFEIHRSEEENPWL
ncbi:MAG: type II toxin-antitoxin system Phd/YefM family antitoxin [Treponema sp.]|nr:type II toxin-antitoxin system Phd/YefM family antitoxin [Candidatus Treponema equifaecale]